MTESIIIGFLLPFFCTVLGAGGVFFLKKTANRNMSRLLSAFSAGIMLAASIWSLILPSLEKSAFLGYFAFLPAAAGIFTGTAFLSLNDLFLPEDKIPLLKGNKKTAIMIFAVVLHNIPEGMAVGAAYSGAYLLNTPAGYSAAFLLSLGIAIQNLPEGAIISMPLYAEGMKKGRAFYYGTLSGAVEPLAAAVTFFLSSFFSYLLPFLLGFAAGAMIYVSAADLLPEVFSEKSGFSSSLVFCFGFVLMMALDVALG